MARRVSLDIRLLPGQTPEDVAHAWAMAYDLGVTKVRVIPLESPLIRLQLLSKLSNVCLGKPASAP
jgi:hypothetical protein